MTDTKCRQFIAEDRIARLNSLLIGAWCAIDGDRFDEDGTNNETVMRFLSMARDELKALKSGLSFDALNTDCGY
jgi:hypothetical protein